MKHAGRAAGKGAVTGLAANDARPQHHRRSTRSVVRERELRERLRLLRRLALLRLLLLLLHLKLHLLVLLRLRMED
jgi:hypothetical protein